MANRRAQRPRYVPKPKEIEFNVNIWGDRIATETTQDGSRLDGFQELLRAHGFRVQRVSEPAIDGEAKSIAVKLKMANFTKSGLFESLRRQWCTSVCRPGTPVWLESSEVPRATFHYRSDATRQVLQPLSFSLGSFFDRGTYIKHWSSEDDIVFIEDGFIRVEFEHDTKSLYVIFAKSGEPEGFKEIRLEMGFKQFESYVLVDENTFRGTVEFYFPLQVPPKAFQEVTIHEYTNYDRLTGFLRCTREDLGSSSVLCLSFPLLQEVNVALELMSRMARGGFSIYFAAIKTKVPRGPTEAPTKPEFLDFHVTYALECLLSRGYKVRDRVSRKFYDLLRQATNRYGALQQGLLLPSDKVRKALYHLVARVETNRFCPLEYYLENLLYGDMKHLAAVEFEIPKHYAYVPRLIVTPTQDYLVPPELVAENRVIREYGHKEAMRIAFREEDFSKLASTYLEGLKHVLRERVVGLLTDGILIGRRRFEFLACSNSQLRDHGAWLYATDGEVMANDIRGSLGELESIRCVATFVSRMGQCFSSTKESIKVNIDRGCRVEEIQDIEVGYRNKFFECCNSYRTGTYTFSDGVGKINSTLARKVSESLVLDPTPSAYQIRYGGCKGMLAIDPSLPGGEGQEILLYRKSMKKFDSPHSALEICETTKPNLLYLNRQCILLLSGLGVPDEAFIGLQDNMLRHLASMLLFETVALETLRRANIPGGLKVTALSRSGVNVTREPFFRSLLLAIYKSRLGDLLRRARIAIPETQGRLLMGVIDETGSLEYGQVFVRYSELVSEPGRGVITLKRKVVISKNPCFHPGDMRTFDAVDVTALHHLVDCVVFPAKGPRPHTDEMSGSDLDGDKYFVTWYDRLMPKRENVEPMDFTSPEKIVLSRPVQVSDMIQFVSDYIKNDQLGIIANAHLVHADSEEEGIFSKACIDLAHMHSDAVDFPKTGKCPSLPRDLRPDQYPDFMMKPGKPQYTSQRILGQLFRKCRSLDRAQRYSSDTPQTQVSADKDMIVPGYEQYMEDALEIRDRYNNKLETLMSLYGLKNEGEVITGCLVRVNTRLAGKTDEKFEVAQMIQASLSTLRANTRRDFYEEFGGEDEVMEELQDQGSFSDDVMKKASAWYMATYGGDTAGPDDIDDQENASLSEASRDQPNAKPESSKVTLISFPWVVDRVLAKIKGAKQKEREAKGIQRSHALNEVGDIITDQAAYYYTENFQPDLMRDRDMRLDEKHKLTSILTRLLGEGTAAPRLSLCGASLTGISVGDKLEETPPIEIYAHCGKWDASDLEQFSLLRRLSDSFRLEGSGQLLPNPPELIFTRSRGRLNLLKQQFHITADPSKMLKSAYVGLHVQRCPRLLHLLLVVMHWGRRRHLNGDFKDSFLSNEDLATLFVVFCERFEFIDKVERAEVETYASSLLGILSTAQQDEAERQWTDQVLGNVSRGRLQGFKDKVTPGNALIKFFEHYSTSADDDPVSLCSVKNPFSSRDEKLCPNVTPRERVRFSDAALHAFHELGQCCGLDSIMTSSNESTRELQETLTMPNTTWGALRFAEEFVAAKLSSLTEAQIFIRPAQRSSGYILEATGNYLTLHGVQNELEKLEVTCKSWVYNHTVSGAPQFLFLNQTDQEDMVTYKKLQKDYAVNLSPLLSLLGEVQGDDVAERKFVSQLLTQVQIFKREYLRYMHGAESLTIKAEFGSIYVENVPPLQLHSSVGAAESTLSKNADPKVQSSQARNQHAVMRHKFIPLTGGGDGWTAVFPSAVQHSTPEETYTLGIKSGNKSSHTMTVVCDDNLNFCDVEIPPINWLVTDVKAPRPGNSKSRDVDFRITVSSQRNFEGEEKEKVMKSATYEKFRSKPVITKAANGDLEVTREFQNKMAFVRHDVTTLYRVRFNASELFLRVRSGKKYNVKNARVLNNPKAFSNVQLCGEFKSDEEATTVARDVWAATKRLRPHITS